MVRIRPEFKMPSRPYFPSQLAWLIQRLVSTLDSCDRSADASYGFLRRSSPKRPSISRFWCLRTRLGADRKLFRRQLRPQPVSILELDMHGIAQWKNLAQRSAPDYLWPPVQVSWQTHFLTCARFAFGSRWLVL